MNKLYFINEKIEDMDKIIVFGSGYYGKMAIGILLNKGIKVLECFDNDVEKQKKQTYAYVNCVKPHTTNIPILITVSNKDNVIFIKKQLEDLGCVDILTVNIKKLNAAMIDLADKEFLNLKYYLVFEKYVNWEKPISFNEKLQWLKIYDHNALYPMLVDKAEVKKFVSEKIGKEYIIPTIGIWDKVEDIDFSKLPQKYAIKCTHDSGSTKIIDNNEISKKEFEQQIGDLKKSLERNWFILGREWAYKEVKPRILAEVLLESKNGEEILDYKFMCFNGKVKCVFVCSNRQGHGGLKVTFYDLDWNIMPFERHYPKEEKKIPKPIAFEVMIKQAEKLSKNLPFARIDFYEVDGHPYFGEITLYPGCGLEKFNPEKWDVIMGKWLKLPIAI